MTKARKLKNRMREVGLRQSRVAMRLNMAPSYLCNMLNGLLPLPDRIAMEINKAIRAHAFKLRKKAEKALAGE